MDPLTKLAAIVGLLVALSAASERLVEIVKGLSSFLDKKQDDDRRERLRRAALQALAVGAGIVTVFLARPALPEDLLPATSTGLLPVLALGLLVSGGSGLWNSILTYLLSIKDIKEELAKTAEARTKAFQDITRTLAADQSADGQLKAMYGLYMLEQVAQSGGIALPGTDKTR